MSLSKYWYYLLPVICIYNRNFVIGPSLNSSVCICMSRTPLCAIMFIYIGNCKINYSEWNVSVLLCVNIRLIYQWMIHWSCSDSGISVIDIFLMARLHLFSEVSVQCFSGCLQMKCFVPCCSLVQVIVIVFIQWHRHLHRCVSSPCEVMHTSVVFDAYQLLCLNTDICYTTW